MEGLSQRTMMFGLVLASLAVQDAAHAQVRSVTPHMQSTPQKFVMAAPPVHALPAAKSAPPPTQVATGGTRINADGTAHGAGAAGVAGAVGEQQYVQLAAGRMTV